MAGTATSTGDAGPTTTPTRFEGAKFTLVDPSGTTDVVELGYPEGGGEHVIIVFNGVWIGTLLNAQAAEGLAQFMSMLAATPAENLGWEPLEGVQHALAARAPGATFQAP